MKLIIYFRKQDKKYDEDRKVINKFKFEGNNINNLFRTNKLN